MFNELKTTHAAAYLIRKEGGAMPYLKLIKLLYFADRQYMLLYGESISGDDYCSMKNGPVLSKTYNLIKSSDKSFWNDLILTDQRKYEVSFRSEYVSLDDLDELNRANIKVLDAIYDQYGELGPYEIADLSHDICDEWNLSENAKVESIDKRNIFIALGSSEAEADRLISRLNEIDHLEKSLDLLR